MNFRPRVATVNVFLVFGLISVSAMVVAQHVVRQEEARLVTERAAEVGGQLTNAAASTDSSLRSLATLAPLPQAGVSFPAAATPLLTGNVRTIALLAEHSGTFSAVAVVGDTTTLGPALSRDREALFLRAIAEPDMVSGVLHDGFNRRIGFALALPPDEGNLVVYEENAINPIDVPPTPTFADLNVAIYAASSPTADALVVAKGPTGFNSSALVLHPSAGAGQWTLIVQPTQPLSGSFASTVPWLLLIGGLVSALLAAAVVEIVLRRRDFAMMLVDERTRELRTSLHNLEHAQKELRYQAFHDALTKLPNRVLLIDRLTQALGRSQRKLVGTAVVFLDLDRFKRVNDSLGHPAGDRLITAVAERLGVALRQGDTVARLGGDEFVVLCEELVDQSDATFVAQRMADCLVDPFDIEGHHIEITASFGISYSPSSADSPMDMLREADLAMYQAKERGRNRIELFHPSMRSRADVRLETEEELRLAIERHQLQVHYQPMLRLSDGAVVGAEALVRWQDEHQALILPAEFIALAEETGLIIPLGLQVLNTACAQAAEWTRQNSPRERLSVSVNLSARQLEHPFLVEEVSAALADSGLAPDLLWLEITESVLVEESGLSLSTLHALKELGVTLVVDDFGTGYSSLLYIRRFPVDVLKIDRSFVAGLGRQRADDTIVSTVIELAHALDLTAVAEGVETVEQAERLAALGCEFAQGYYWSRPVVATAATLWMDATSGAAAVR
ncbi:MAG TPA: EAL domain-containing protein [Acidimicrobiales bacterium]|nr:EAL domain-containing protein [Acidimicrobiales bacterium]